MFNVFVCFTFEGQFYSGDFQGTTKVEAMQNAIAWVNTFEGRFEQNPTYKVSKI